MSRLPLAQPNLLNKLKHVWFTDESWFTTDGITQKNNQFYWALNKDAVKPVISQKYPIKVHVWAAILQYQCLELLVRTFFIGLVATSQ